MPERVFYLWQVRSFTVRIALDFVEALTECFKEKRLDPAEEHGGLLFGRVIDNNTVEVTGFEFIYSEHHRGISYDLTGGERCRLERHVRSFSKPRDPKPVGYFRTHLRPGLFLDQSDFAVMTESFSDIPGIALTIRTDRPGRWNAGIFFWEDGDIDRSRTELKFPFNAATLRVQGPVETTLTPAITRNEWRASKLKPLAVSLLWGTAAILALAMTYQVNRNSVLNRKGGARRIGTVAVNSPAPAQTPVVSLRPPPVQPETRAVPYSPAKFPEVHDGSAWVSPEGPSQRDSLPAGLPLGLPPAAPPQPAPPPVQSAVQPATEVPPTLNRELPPAAAAPALPPAPVSHPAPLEIATTFSPPAAVPAPEPVAPAASVKSVAVDKVDKSVTVDVSLEAREPSGIKRIAGHVPLLGHLHTFRNETGRNFISARPAASLRPRVPVNLTQSIEGQIAVDVVVSIDDQGLVRNTEITKGAETGLAMFAVNTVRSIPWEPARSGDHNVPMDMVVHYRFNPAE
jgi:hypothetical protein